MTIAEIKHHLLTQDNRLTADPVFCVQVQERIGPIIEGHTGNLAFFSHRDVETYYQDRSPERWQELKALHDDGELPGYIEVYDYVEQWITVQTCFTEAGAKKHLELNGHNYRTYFGVRIYAEGLFRNPEMIAIRKMLMGYPEAT